MAFTRPSIRVTERDASGAATEIEVGPARNGGDGGDGGRLAPLAIAQRPRAPVQPIQPRRREPVAPTRLVPIGPVKGRLAPIIPITDRPAPIEERIFRRVEPNGEPEVFVSLIERLRGPARLLGGRETMEEKELEEARGIAAPTPAPAGIEPIRELVPEASEGITDGLSPGMGRNGDGPTPLAGVAPIVSGGGAQVSIEAAPAGAPPLAGVSPRTSLRAIGLFGVIMAGALVFGVVLKRRLA